MTRIPDYAQYDALGLADLVARRQVSPAELLEEAIARCEAVNPQVNAVIRPMYEQARIRAHQPFEGRFAGVPSLLKDLIAAFAGVEMSSGSRFFQGYVPPQDEIYVQRLKQAGLNLFGKTNTPEFGITPSTEPELTGASRNPWNLAHSPGGSSGGAAAAIAAGIVPMASASDGGGSIRIPASCCGLFGLKPSRGRVPSGPQFPDGWFGFIAEHVISRSVRDSAVMLDALQGPYPSQLMRLPHPAQSYESALAVPRKGLKIAYSLHPGLGERLAPDCQEGVLKTVRLLTDMGHHCEEVSLPIPQPEEFIYAYSVLVAAEMAATRRHGETLMGKKAHARDFEARTWAVMTLGEIYSAGEVSSALWTLQAFSRQWMQFFEPYDALLTSTLGDLPIAVGGLRPSPKELVELLALRFLPIGQIAKQRSFVLQSGRRVFNYCSQTMPANVTGQPSMSVPLHWSASGLPVGMMFTGRFGEEDLLLNLAAQLEVAQPWAGRRPPVFAA